MRKFLSLVLSLLMACTFIPVATMSASAEGETVFIGDTGYTNFNDAMSAYKAGDVITLKGDAETTSSNPAWKRFDVEVDLGGYTLTCNSTRFATQSNDASTSYTYTVKNGTLLSNCTDVVFYIRRNMNLTLNNVNITQTVGTNSGYGAVIGLRPSAEATDSDTVSKINLINTNITTTANSDIFGHNPAKGTALLYNLNAVNCNFTQGGNRNIFQHVAGKTYWVDGGKVNLDNTTLTRTSANFNANDLSNVYVADGSVVSNTENGAAIDGIVTDGLINQSVAANYAKLYVYTPSNPLAVDVSMQAGAAMRLNDLSGIRYYTNVDTAKIAALKAAGATVEMGTLIAPVDLLEGAELTLDTAEGNCANVVYSADEYYTEDDFTGIVGSLVSIKDTNANRSFIGRGYVKVTQGEDTYVSYASVNTTDNARTIAWIATQIKADGEYDGLVDSAKTVVDHYADLYVA